MDVNKNLGIQDSPCESLENDDFYGFKKNLHSIFDRQ